MGCSICKDDGGCLNSPSHPNYEEYYDAEDKLSYFNCWNYLKHKENEEKKKPLFNFFTPIFMVLSSIKGMFMVLVSVQSYNKILMRWKVFFMRLFGKVAPFVYFPSTSNI